MIELGAVSLDYQAYATKGLADGVLDNDSGRISIPEGRAASLFEEDTNGEPAATGRLAVRVNRMAELGVSGWRGAYNVFQLEGEDVDERRALSFVALDFALTPDWLDLRGEFAWSFVDVPVDLVSAFGDRQGGGHVDAVVPVWRPSFSISPRRCRLAFGWTTSICTWATSQTEIGRAKRPRE